MLGVVTAELPDLTPVVVAPVSGLAEKLSAPLGSLSLVGVARDGDCLVVAPRVSAAVRQIGMAADTVDVIGWLDPAVMRSVFPELRLLNTGEQRIVGFRHQVTVAGRWVLDATARQFRGDLPQRWVAPLGQYLGRLAAATGVAEVTLAASARSTA